jgi:hypothetical protein
VPNLGRDLGNVLGAVNAAGVELADMTLRGSTLHDAFIALTGRELRE